LRRVRVTTLPSLALIVGNNVSVVAAALPHPTRPPRFSAAAIATAAVAALA